MSIPLSTLDLSSITSMLSRERLHTLLELTGSLASAIDLHQETLKLGASLMSIIATIEIALRNSVCDNLRQHFGSENWLLLPSGSFQWREPERSKISAALDSAKRAAYSKLSQSEKAQLDRLAYPQGRPKNTSHLNRSKDRRKQIIVSEGKVIAELTLYFWKRVYGPEYEQSLWRTTLKRTFPNKSLARAEIAKNLEQIYQSRNRIAHHEPVLHGRYEETLKSLHFIIEHLGEKKRNPNSALSKLLTEDINAINAAAQELHMKIKNYRNQSEA